jgi:hypothetical protein
MTNECHNCGKEFEGDGGSIIDPNGKIVFAFCSRECADEYIGKLKK